jgi:hypothetical protein
MWWHLGGFARHRRIERYRPFAVGKSVSTKVVAPALPIWDDVKGAVAHGEAELAQYAELVTISDQYAKGL